MSPNPPTSTQGRWRLVEGRMRLPMKAVNVHRSSPQLGPTNTQKYFCTYANMRWRSATTQIWGAVARGWTAALHCGGNPPPPRPRRAQGEGQQERVGRGARGEGRERGRRPWAGMGVCRVRKVSDHLAPPLALPLAPPPALCQDRMRHKGRSVFLGGQWV